MTGEQFETYNKTQVLEAYKALFSSNDGQIVLEDLKRAHHFYDSTIMVSPIDPLQMAFAEGERNVILRILTLLENRG